MRKSYLSWISIFVFCSLILNRSAPVLAIYSKSNSYSIDETLLGGTGLSNQSSTNFSARTSAGDITVGDAASSNQQAKSNNVSDAEPVLSFIVNAGAINFTAPFSKTATSYATTGFSVKDYTSYGYTVNLYGTTLTQTGASYTLPAMAANAAATTGIEQFGVNLVANTGFGANPVQVPSTSFSNGLASVNYNTPNSFRFVSGDQVAQANKSSGQTDFTLSYIANVKGTTPGGTYSAVQELICIATY